MEENKDLNRIKVMLAEKKRTNKWLAEQAEQLHQRTEQENARGEEAAHSMKMNPEFDE